jgi:Ca2+-binding EF-hand superfamily protein
MRTPLLLLAMASSSAYAQVSPKTPITVTGHQWAPFISPMGEPFRARTPTDDTLADWFTKADRNRDGVLTAAEMVADADRFFATLDTNHDGKIDPDELAQYEYDIAPDVQVMSKTRRPPGAPAPVVKRPKGDELDVGSDDRPDKDRRRERSDDDDASLGIGGALQGAARYGLLNMPEPVSAADTDFNRAITLEEFRAAALARFQLLDRTHQGQLTLAQLEASRPVLPTGPHHPKRNLGAADARLGNPLPPGH